MIKRFLRTLVRKLRIMKSNVLRSKDSNNARAAVELSRMELPYLPWPGSAIAPSSLCSILNEIQINKRHNIVEFGCGVSTLYIAEVLRRTEGHIFSIENNQDWMTVVQKWIDDANLNDKVTMIYAPLSASNLNNHQLDWYDKDIINSAIGDITVDCIFVDGPPSYEKELELARYPALPVMYEKMNNNCVVFLDDINREGEQKVLKKWMTDYPGIKFSWYDGINQVGRGVRGSAFSSKM